MLGVEGYGSGSDNDSDVETTTTTAAPVKPVPTNPTTASEPGVSLPPPKQGKRPKKITIDLPKPSKRDEEEDEPEQPPTKKARRDGKGAGVSGLLSMLPAPKQVAPVKLPQPGRVLGGGNAPALSFNSAHQSTEDDPDVPTVAKMNLFVPNSITRGKANVSTEDSGAGPSRPRAAPSTPAVDFFSLGATVATRRRYYCAFNAVFEQDNRPRTRQPTNKASRCRCHFHQSPRRQRSKSLCPRSRRHRTSTLATTVFHLENGLLTTRNIIGNSTRNGRLTTTSMCVT